MHHHFTYPQEEYYSTPMTSAGKLWLAIFFSFILVNASLYILMNAAIWRPRWEARFVPYLLQTGIAVQGQRSETLPIQRDTHDKDGRVTDMTVVGFRFTVTYTAPEGGVMRKKMSLRTSLFDGDSRTLELVVLPGQPNSALILKQIQYEVPPHVGASRLCIYVGGYGGVYGWILGTILFCIGFGIVIWQLVAQDANKLHKIAGGSVFFSLVGLNILLFFIAPNCTRKRNKGYPNEFERLLGVNVEGTIYALTAN